MAKTNKKYSFQDPIEKKQKRKPQPKDKLKKYKKTLYNMNHDNQYND